MSRYDSNPFDEEEVNPFAGQGGLGKRGESNYGGRGFYTTNPGSVPPATSILTPLPPEPYDRGATIDIPIDNAKELKAKGKVHVLWYRPLYRAMRGILPAITILTSNVMVRIFYFIGFAFSCLESLLSIWVLQQVYMYIRDSGKAAEMKRNAAKRTMMLIF